MLWAASRHNRIHHACEVLEGMLSDSDRYHLSKLNDIQGLETHLNQALPSRLPKDIINNRHRLAIDLRLTMINRLLLPNSQFTEYDLITEAIATGT